MREIEYEEIGDTATLATEADGEWLASDSIVVLSDWT